MVHFPLEVFDSILSYCYPRIDEQQKAIWSSIQPTRQDTEDGVWFYAISNKDNTFTSSDIVEWNERVITDYNLFNDDRNIDIELEEGEWLGIGRVID